MLVSIESVRLTKWMPSLLEVTDQIDELLDAPPEPVELPDDERVALPELFERPLESRAVGDLSAHGVIEDLVAS